MIQTFVNKKVFFIQKQFGVWIQKKTLDVSSAFVNRTLTILMLIIGVSACSRPGCLKDKIILGDRYQFVGDVDVGDSYFVFSDTGQVEYQNGYFFSKSRIHWHNCTAYSLVISEIVDTSILKVNDTIKFTLHSFYSDTFKYTVEGKGRIMESSFFRESK